MLELERVMGRVRGAVDAWLSVLVTPGEGRVRSLCHFLRI